MSEKDVPISVTAAMAEYDRKAMDLAKGPLTDAGKKELKWSTFTSYDELNSGIKRTSVTPKLGDQTNIVDYIKKKEDKKTLDNIYNYCNLNNLDAIIEEIEKFLVGYEIIDVKYDSDIICNLVDKNKNRIILTATKDGLHIHTEKGSRNYRENIYIDLNNLTLTSQAIEKRYFGIVYSTIRKHFTKRHIFDKECVLDGLSEQRYVFTRDTLKSIIKDLDFEKDWLFTYDLEFSELIRNGTLKDKCDYYNEFSTYMNKLMWMDNSPRLITDNKYTTRTFVNGKEMSNIYDIVDGYDKLYRVYDLYNGKINERNLNDIDAIRLGFLKRDAYDLNGLLGIKINEDSLIGPSINEEDGEYIKYLTELFYKKYNYTGEISLDRNNILHIIANKTEFENSEDTIEEESKESTSRKILRRIFKRKK